MDLRDENMNLKQQIQALKEQIRQLELRIQELEDIIRQLELRIQELEAELIRAGDTNTTEIQNKLQEIQDLREVLQERDKLIKELAGAIEFIISELDKLDVDIIGNIRSAKYQIYLTKIYN